MRNEMLTYPYATYKIYTCIVNIKHVFQLLLPYNLISIV